MECHKCKWRDDPDRLERCLRCKLPEDGQPMHGGRNAAVYLDAHEGFVDTIEAKDASEPSGGVTRLPLEVEDKLRQMLAAFAGLAPIDALLAHHLAAGRSLASFWDAWREVAGAFLKADASAASSANRARSFAWTRSKRLVAALGAFKSLVPTNGAKNKGGGKKPKRKPTYTQEELL